METLFTNELHPSRHDELLARLKERRMGIDTFRDYPLFDQWAHKVHRELGSGKKRALVAIARRKIRAAIIYQRAPHDDTVLEIRNITVDPDYEGRLYGSMMLRNVLVEGIVDFPGVGIAQTDTKVSNLAMHHFLLRQGFIASEPIDLYGHGEKKLDRIYTSVIRRPRRIEI